jgi:hypothetical protein
MNKIHNKKNRQYLRLILLLVIGMVTVFGTPLIRMVFAEQLAQIPTGSIPTVTGTPIGAYIIVNTDNEQVNVRAYPDPLADKVGVLLGGQKVAAKGKCNGYILVDYPGILSGEAWVYINLVTTFGTIPDVEAPSTPTPLYTSTIDPTLAAQFLVTLAPTRLPTFTEPPALIIQTYPPDETSQAKESIPIGMVIAGIGVMGVLLGLVSLIRGR